MGKIGKKSVMYSFFSEVEASDNFTEFGEIFYLCIYFCNCVCKKPVKPVKDLIRSLGMQQRNMKKLFCLNFFFH